MNQKTKIKVEQYVEEYIKCKSDFEYFARNYIYLEVVGGDILYTPYKKQLEYVQTLQDDKFIVCLKTRQTGISTTTQAYCAWLLNFYDNTVVGVISKDGKEATDFSRAIRNMIEKLPFFLTPKKGKESGCFDKKSEQSFILSNGSKLYVATVNPAQPEKTLRGKPVTFLVIDEAAFINKLDIAWTSLVPALSTAQKAARLNGVPYGVAIISTPNKTVGMGAWYFSRYTKAMNKEGIFKPAVVYWRDIPELANDPNWYKTQCEMFDNDNKKIEQELELKFLPAGGSFFDEKTCLKIQEACKEPIEVFRIFNSEVWKFANPIEGKYYIIGVDTAPEFGEDKSAITIWDYETLDQVWEFQGKLKVLDFVKIVQYALSQYPGCVVIENNSYGNQVMEQVSDSEYVAMVYREKRGENKVAAGLSNNAKTRPLMIDALYSYVTQFPQMIKSKRTALELIGLVDKKGKVEADVGCHDDLALSLSFCMYVRKYDPPLFIDVNKVRQNAFLDIINMNTNQVNQFPDDASIMKHVKQNVFTIEEALVNTLKYYHRG
jgi:hypothetical protein